MQFLEKLWKMCKNRNMEFVTIEVRTNYLASERKVHTTIFFPKKLLVKKIQKPQILMTALFLGCMNALYFDLKILEISEIVMYEFWLRETKIWRKMKLCYINTDSFIVYRKTENIYSDIAKDVKTGFDASIYELDRSLSEVKIKKIIGLIKDEIGEKYWQSVLQLIVISIVFENEINQLEISKLDVDSLWEKQIIYKKQKGNIKLTGKI